MGWGSYSTLFSCFRVFQFSSSPRVLGQQPWLLPLLMAFLLIRFISFTNETKLSQINSRPFCITCWHKCGWLSHVSLNLSFDEFRFHTESRWTQNAVTKIPVSIDLGFDKETNYWNSDELKLRGVHNDFRWIHELKFLFAPLKLGCLATMSSVPDNCSQAVEPVNHSNDIW